LAQPPAPRRAAPAPDSGSARLPRRANGVERASEVLAQVLQQAQQGGNGSARQQQ
jgi:hypothetical protein